MNRIIAMFLCLALPGLTWANVSNIASVAYRDASGNSYNTTSNTATVITPPVITSAITATGDAGTAFSYQVVGTNIPTSYGATGLPAGLSINTNSGLISGTPTAAGTFTVTLGATNSAGTGSATLTLTIRTGATIVLQKGVSPTTATSGGTVTFTIQYQNTGAGNATAVVITDAVPAGTTLVSGSITGGGTLSSNTITWNLGTIAGSATGTVSFQVRVN